jgi:hypothetical protein
MCQGFNYQEFDRRMPQWYISALAADMVKCPQSGKRYIIILDAAKAVFIRIPQAPLRKFAIFTASQATNKKSKTHTTDPRVMAMHFTRRRNAASLTRGKATPTGSSFSRNLHNGPQPIDAWYTRSFWWGTKPSTH